MSFKDLLTLPIACSRVVILQQLCFFSGTMPVAHLLVRAKQRWLAV